MTAKPFLLALLLTGVAFADPDAPQQMMQQQAYEPPPPVQQQLEHRLSDRCQIKLDYYRGMVNEIPDNWYYNYMLNKWEKRCLPN